MQIEQTLVAKLLHSLQAPDPATQFELLQIAQQQLYLGGLRRLRHTLPALGFAVLQLVRRIAGGEASSGKGEWLCCCWRIGVKVVCF